MFERSAIGFDTHSLAFGRDRNVNLQCLGKRDLMQINMQNIALNWIVLHFLNHARTTLLFLVILNLQRDDCVFNLMLMNQLKQLAA